MTYKQLDKVLSDGIDSVIDDETKKVEISIKGKEFEFTINIISLCEEIVVVFGGYGLHFESYGTSAYDNFEIIEKFKNYVNSYGDDGGEKLDNCKLVS